MASTSTPRRSTESRGWQWKGKGAPVDESATATAALRHGVELPGHLFGLHELRARGHRLELAGREKVNGANFYRPASYPLGWLSHNAYTLIQTPGWSRAVVMCVRSIPILTPRPTTIENEVSDFRRVGELLYPFASIDRDLATGKILGKNDGSFHHPEPGV